MRLDIIIVAGLLGCTGPAPVDDDTADTTDTDPTCLTRPLADATACAEGCPVHDIDACAQPGWTRYPWLGTGTCTDGLVTYRIVYTQEGSDREAFYFHPDDDALLAIALQDGTTPADCGTTTWFGEDFSRCVHDTTITPLACDTDPPVDETDVDGFCFVTPLEAAPLCQGSPCPRRADLDLCDTERFVGTPRTGSCVIPGSGTLEVLRWTDATSGDLWTVYINALQQVVAMSADDDVLGTCIPWWGVDVTRCDGTTAFAPVDCSVPDTDPDTDPTDVPETDTAPPDTDLPPWDTDTPVRPARVLQPGELVITELHVNPDNCSDAFGEYIEIRNVSATSVDLFGLDIVIDGSSFRVNTSITVPAGGYATAQPDAVIPCWGFQHLADVRYGLAMTMSNTGSLVQIRNRTDVLDTVDARGWHFSSWPGVPFPSGRAVQLRSGQETASANDDEDAWCLAATPLTGGAGGNYGTPRAVADACYTPPTDTAIHTGETATDTDPRSDREVCLADPARDASDGLSPEELCPGDLLITEIMVDPRDCATERAQYLEIFNTSGATIRLDGLAVDLTGTAQIYINRPVTLLGSTAEIAPGAYGTIVMKTFFTYCHTFTRNARVEGLLLQEGALRLHNSTWAIDAVDTTGWSFFPGFAWQLSDAAWLPLPANPALIDPAVNDQGSDWCLGGATIPAAFPATDRGTPGLPNNCTTDTATETESEFEPDSDSDVPTP